jgi:hypothetical protein
MKNEAPYMTEEHIVAWLDGELQADGEVRQALKQDPALKAAARDYAGLSNAVTRSMSDARFVLPAAVDARVHAALESEIARNRKAVRVPQRAADAEPITKPSTVDRMKKVWIRRTSYAAVLALLIGGLWLGLQSKDESPVTAYAPKEEAPASQPNAVIAESTPAVSEPAPAVSNEPKAANHQSRTMAVNHTLASNEKPVVTEPAPAPAAQQTAEVTDPAAIMISHRYAKLIKSTPTVVVSQSDKIDRM